MFEWLTRVFGKESGAEAERGPIVVQGRRLRCNVCGNTSFRAKQVQLDTPMLAFLDIAAWNGVADCAICERCGHMHWFVTPPAAEHSSAGTTEKAGGVPNAGGAPT